MTKHPIRIDMNSKISDVVNIASERELHRTPITSGKELVGLVTEGMILKESASKVASLSIYGLGYLLSGTNVNTTIIRDVIAVHEDRFLEDAALLIYKYDIGCLPVIDGIDEIIGILTSNDVLSAFLDVLGHRTNGDRVCIEVKDEPGTISKILGTFIRNSYNITYLGVYSQHNGFMDIAIHIDTFQTDALVSDLEANGYKVLGTTKNPN